MNKEQVLGILRHTLTFVGGILITKGLIDANTLTELSGAIITLVGGVWSVLAKK
jgi:flagellar motor component MotA